MTDQVSERISEYLQAGGLFNPEAMDHDKVRDLLIECRDHIDALAAENAKLRAACEAAHELSDAELIAWCKECAVEKRKEAECADYDHWRNSYIREADTFDAIAARLAQPVQEGAV